MKVLVTGANGFLGTHVVRTLLQVGYEVRAFILKGTSIDILEGLSYELFEGNLLHQEDIEAALNSCDYVIHTAAITDIWPTKNELSWDINYEVVKNISEAVKKSSIKKYINVGTANSFGSGSLEHPGTEKSTFNCGVYKLDYIDSKKAAQDYLLQQASLESLPVVIINPTFMIGEYDAKPGTGEMILSVIKGKLPGYSGGGRCFAAVKDVARACVNAIEHGRTGECYITGGTNLNYKDFFELIALVAHVKPPKIYIPKWIAVPFAAMLEFLSSITKNKPKITVAMARISSGGHYYSSQKAIQELNYTMTDLKQALQEAITWYKNNGYM